MSDINGTRLPHTYHIIYPPYRPYVSDDVNHILDRGQKWAQHPFNEVTIVFMCARVLAFAEYLAHY